MEDRAFNISGLNAPSWSLFWEYIANIVYALVLCRLTRKYLMLLAIIGAPGIVYVSYNTGNLMGGWGKDNFWDGGIRLAYSFLAGLLVYRYNWIIKNRLGFIGLSLLLNFAFLVPYTSMNWLAETLVVLFYFPLLVALGAGATIHTRLKDTCKFSGDISYPLYMTHYAGIWIFASYFTSIDPDNVTLTFLVVTGTLAMVGFTYLVMKFYDSPLRNYLKNKREVTYKKITGLSGNNY